MSHPSDHTPQWVDGEPGSDQDGRTWCRACGYAAFPQRCVVCGQVDDEATLKHGVSGDRELHQPVFNQDLDGYVDNDQRHTCIGCDDTPMYWRMADEGPVCDHCDTPVYEKETTDG